MNRRGNHLLLIVGSISSLGLCCLMIFAFGCGKPNGSGIQVAEKQYATKPIATGIRDNRELFKKWDEKKPEFVLCLTGRQNGYIEPCGCTGLANQKGGLARRDTFYKQLAARGWPMVKLDVGNLIRRFGVQPALKFQATADALKKQKYDAVCFGPDDLRLSLGDLIASVAPEKDDDPSMFVCANANLVDINAKFRVIEIAQQRIGVTGFIGKQEQKKIQNAEVELSDPTESLKPVLAELKKQKCDVLVLLAHASTKETIEVSKALKEFNIAVTAGGADEPALQPRRIKEIKTILVEVGGKGMYVGVIGFFKKETPTKTLARPTEILYERVVLDDRYEDSKRMLEILHSYQKQLETMGLDGLGLRPVVHPSGNKFVGSETCGDCHTKAYEKWLDTPHSHATKSIAEPTERSEIKRHHDPECLSCHVTGWSPQDYFPYHSGYTDLVKSADKHANGCENCHGPGSKHVAAELGDIEVTEQQRKQLQLSMRVAFDEQKCMTCHDLDNSPQFHVDGEPEKYWKKIAHPWRD